MKFCVNVKQTFCFRAFPFIKLKTTFCVWKTKTAKIKNIRKKERNR